MALFTRTSKKKEKNAVASVSPKTAGVARDLSHVLHNPRITEKSSNLQAMGVYVFNVGTHATKRDIALAVERLFKVKPMAVRIVKSADKNTRNMRTGKRGVERGGRKAYISLKKGETINLA